MFRNNVDSRLQYSNTRSRYILQSYEKMLSSYRPENVISPDCFQFVCKIKNSGQ